MKKNSVVGKMRKWAWFLAVALCLTAPALKAADDENLKEEVAALRALVERQGDELRQVRETNAKDPVVPQQLTSMKKNAQVTIGGRVRTRYYYRDASVDHDTGGGMARAGNAQRGDLMEKDAKLNIGIKVNDHLDAYFRIDLQSSDRKIGPWGGSDNAEQAWLRWKNINETGFGILIGRDALKFGQDDNPGALGSYVSNNGEGLSEISNGAFGQFLSYSDNNDGRYSRSAIAPHNTWDVSRITQITPFWESKDGLVRLEASLMQRDNTMYNDLYAWNADSNAYRAIGKDWKSNDFGSSFSTRAIFKPTEGMMATLSFMGLHQSNSPFNLSFPGHNLNLSHASYNYAFGAAFSYRPPCFSQFKFWTQWIHGWNVENIKDLDSDAVSVGASYDFTKQLSIFAVGDYLHVKQSNVARSWVNEAWSAYGGVKYTLPYGVLLEAGWKHERVTDTVNGAKRSKAKADTIYSSVTLDF